MSVGRTERRSSLKRKLRTYDAMRRFTSRTKRPWSRKPVKDLKSVFDIVDAECSLKIAKFKIKIKELEVRY